MLLDTNNRRAISPIGMPRPSSTRTSISRFVNWTRNDGRRIYLRRFGFEKGRDGTARALGPIFELPDQITRYRRQGRQDTGGFRAVRELPPHVLAAAGILPSSHRAAHSISRDSSRNLVRYCPLQSISRHNSNAWDGDPVRRCVRATETVTTANVCGAATDSSSALVPSPDANRRSIRAAVRSASPSDRSHGFTCPCVATARWREISPENGSDCSSANLV